MLFQNALVALVSAVAVSAVPLNINLGAYSPALVVGDGEISLGSAGEASALMATLATGAVANEAAAAQAQQAPAAAPAGQEGEGAPATGEQQAAAVPIPAPVTGETPAAQPAVEGAPTTEGGSPSRAIQQGLEPGAIPNMKRGVADEDELALSQEALADALDVGRKLMVKRDFAQALGYASEAMKNQPQVDLGTEAAGVGIIVSPGVNVPVNSAANGVNPAGTGTNEKRSLDAPEIKKRGITLIALAEI